MIHTLSMNLQKISMNIFLGIHIYVWFIHQDLWFIDNVWIIDQKHTYIYDSYIFIYNSYKKDYESYLLIYESYIRMYNSYITIDFIIYIYFNSVYSSASRGSGRHHFSPFYSTFRRIHPVLDISWLTFGF